MLGFLSGWSLGAHDAEIKSILNEYHWPPKVIDELFCDDYDYHGVIYLYEHLAEMHSKIKK